MIKDVFVLNPNGWHSRMLKFMWNIRYYDFTHICPYFWLCVFSVIVFIPFVVFKYIFKALFIYPLNKFNDYLDKLEENDMKRAAEQLNVNPSLVTEFAKKKKYRSKLLSYLYNGNYDLYNKFNRAITSYYQNQNDQTLAKEYELRDARMARKQRINNFVRWTKPVTKIFVILLTIAASLFLIYGTYKFTIYLIHFPHKSWVNFGKLITVVFLTILAYIIFSSFITSAKRFNFPKVGGSFILSPIKSFFRGIQTLFMIIITMIKNNCPAIEWKR